MDTLSWDPLPGPPTRGDRRGCPFGRLQRTLTIGALTSWGEETDTVLAEHGVLSDRLVAAHCHGTTATERERRGAGEEVEETLRELGYM